MKLLSAYYFVSYLSFAVFLPYTSLYFSEQGFSNTAVGLILSLWAFVGVIAQPAMGMINDRSRNPRIVLMVSVIMAPLIGIGFLYIHQLAFVIALSVVFAWFQSSTSPLADSIAVEMASQKGISFGNIRLWGALSYSLGTFTIGFLYDRYGYGHIFVSYLAVAAVGYAMLFWFPKAKSAHHSATLFEQAKEVISHRPFMIFVSICLLMVMSSATSFTYLPIYFKELGFDNRFLGSAFAVAALIEVPMFWIATRLSRKIGRFHLLCIASAIYGLRCLLLFLFHDVYLTLGLQLLDGISFAFAAGTFVEIVDSYASKRTKATFQTIFAAVTWGLGGIIGNAAGGVVADQLGTPALYLILFIISSSASCLFMLRERAQAKNKHDIIVPMN